MKSISQDSGWKYSESQVRRNHENTT